MPRTTSDVTTRRSRRSKSSSVEAVAAVSFEAWPTDVLAEAPTRADFMGSASDAFVAIRLGVPMLTKTPTEMVEMFRAMGETDMLQLLSDVGDIKEWAEGLASILSAVEARGYIAASRLAVEG